MTTIILTVLIVCCLVVCSAFFSGSETALAAVSQSKMHALEQDNNWRTKIVNDLLEKSDRLIGSLLLGNNLVNVLASVLATKLMLDLYGFLGLFMQQLL